MNQGHTYQERAPGAAAGRTLLQWLVQRWRHGDEAQWRERIAAGEVAVGGRVAAEQLVLRAGDPIEWRRPPWEEPRVPLSFALLLRDDDFLGVLKPAGLPTMPSGGRFLQHTLLHQVRRRFPEASLLHRLDRGTSGVVLLARTPRARRAGSELFRNGTIERRYVGRVEGSPPRDRFTIEAPIGELPHPVIGRVFAVAPEGRRCTTHVEVLEREGATSLVAIRIESGRPHQIRIHLAFAGHPLAGEPFYGPGGRPLAATSALPGDPGYHLHAESLLAPHPFLPHHDLRIVSMYRRGEKTAEVPAHPTGGEGAREGVRFPPPFLPRDGTGANS